MVKVWQETWRLHRMSAGDSLSAIIEIAPELWIKVLRTNGASTTDRLAAMSAAPDLARALLSVEWSGPGGLCVSCEHATHSADCIVNNAIEKARLR